MLSNVNICMYVPQSVYTTYSSLYRSSLVQISKAYLNSMLKPKEQQKIDFINKSELCLIRFKVFLNTLSSTYQLCANEWFQNVFDNKLRTFFKLMRILRLFLDFSFNNNFAIFDMYSFVLLGSWIHLFTGW